MSKLSIKDMAKALNISTAAISYILNGRAKEMRISEDLAKKVLKYAKDKNYNPSRLSISLRTGRTDIICLMVEDITDSFFSGMAGRIAELARPLGYKIVYMSTYNDTERTRELIRDLRLQNVDAFIITPPDGIEKDVRRLVKEGIPVVLFDRPLPDYETFFVGVDNKQVSYDAVKHLHEQGFRNIAFITLNSTQGQMAGRLEGYRRAIHRLKHPSLVKKIDYGEHYTPAAVDKVVAFLQQNPGIDALFFATDYLAVTGLEALQRLGLKVGRDIGMVVFDDNNFLRAYSPSITAIAQPVQELSEAIIRLLNEQLSGKAKRRPQQVILPANLVVRQSSMPLEHLAEKH